MQLHLHAKTIFIKFLIEGSFYTIGYGFPPTVAKYTLKAVHRLEISKIALRIFLWYSRQKARKKNNYNHTVWTIHVCK